MLAILATLLLAPPPCLARPQTGKNPIELDHTGVPWAASFKETARPIPRVPPVTSAIFPDRGLSITGELYLS